MFEEFGKARFVIPRVFPKDLASQLLVRSFTGYGSG